MSRAERIHDTLVVAILAAVMVLCIGAMVMASAPMPNRHGCTGSCGINWDKTNWGRGVA